MQSSNGYPASPHPDAIGVRPFVVRGVVFPSGVKAGDVATILKYVFTYLDANVEKIHSGWCWGYYFKPNVNNPTQLSDHSSASAGDYNAPAHPNGKRGTFSTAQLVQIRKLLSFLEGTVKWGGDYHYTKDEMHWGISDETTAAAVRRVAEKIRRGETQHIKSPVSRLLTTKRAKAMSHDGLVSLRLVQRGKTNFDVLEVQRVLNQWYPHFDLLEDGEYGASTAIALVRARRSLGLRGDVTKDRTKRKVLRKLGFKVIK
jgi:hypothetical protein